MSKLEDACHLLRAVGLDQDDLELTDDGVAWSVPSDDPEEVAGLNEHLWSLVPAFRALGYDVTSQDDPDYFGGYLTPLKRDR